MTTLTLQTVGGARSKATRVERLMLDIADGLSSAAVRHIERRGASASVAARRAEVADIRRDASAAGNLGILPR